VVELVIERARAVEDVGGGDQQDLEGVAADDVVLTADCDSPMRSTGAAAASRSAS
jgi:hypothetical protein